MPKAGLLPRKAAWEVLQAVARGAYSDVALDRVLKKYEFSSVDKRLVTELSYGSIRLQKSLDCWIDFLGKVPSHKQPPLLRLLMHLGLYQILKMDKIPSSAAINTTVELAKNSQLRRLTSVVNGFLRSVDRSVCAGDFPSLPGTASASIVQIHSLPLWLADDLISWFGENKAEEIAQASNDVPSFDLRINRLRCTTKEIKIEFENVGIISKYIVDLPYGLEVKSGLGDLKEWPGYKEGKWCVQDRSSQKVSILLAPQPGEKVLDACSAPGSKTTHLGELMGNVGEIWAVDRARHRLNLVDVNAARMGTDCINVLEADSLNLLEIKPLWRSYFHRILLDAPCSGLGTLARNPDARWRITPEKIDELVHLQMKLLKSVLPLLIPGGSLVYSTCTIHPEENSRQIERFLSICPDLKLKYQQQILPKPGEGGDGFYSALLERL